jgi:uncharacterized protein DUF6489
MKVNIEIDCTPEEARHFFGLPDLRPMQDAVLAKMQQQMLDAVSATTPEALLRLWMPLVPQTPDGMRDAMTRMMTLFTPGGGTGGGGGKPRRE